MAEIGNTEINQLNIARWSQPWYQEWLQSQGQDQNNVHLSDSQRQLLGQAMAQHGQPLTEGLIVDSSGNLNKHHGFAGLPGWAKALIIGGTAVAGGAVLAPVISGAGAAGGGAGAATAGGSVLPSTAIGTGMATSVPSIVGAGTAAGVGGASAAGTGGILSSIGSVGKALPAIGQMTGALTKGMAANRGTSAELALAQGELGTSQEAENRAERGDAWKKLLNANYILNDKGYTAPVNTNRFSSMATLPTYGMARTGEYSDTVKQGATGMQAEVLKRLIGGSQLPATDLTQYGNPSVWEKILGIAAPVATGLGSIYGARSA